MGMDIERDLREACDAAPPMRCGACRGRMKAREVTLTVLFPPLPDLDTPFEPAALARFFERRYSGTIRYVCESCGIELTTVQRIDISDGRYTFAAPDEARGDGKGRG